MNFKNIKRSNITTVIIAVVLGLGLGWLLFGGSPSTNEVDHTGHDHVQVAEEGEGEETIWTCAMHPQIRQNKPGKCPICGMELTPLEETEGTADNVFTLQMSEDAIKLANIQTTTVASGEASGREMVLTGKIEVDERRIYEIPAHFHGRIEKLYVNFTGEYVSRGEILASVYSPDLITAQQELLEVLSYKETSPAMYKAARNKLKNWKIADSEIDKIEQRGEVVTELPVRAHHAGYVMERNVSVGDHLKMGDIMFEVADLSQLWVMLDAYEQHLAAIEEGDKVQFTVASRPGKEYEAKVTYIDPFINPETRVAQVRAEVVNEDRKLKPEMFVRATVKAAADTKTASLVIPRSAVLWTGKRSLVYVKKQEYEQPTFEYREIVLGPVAGDYYVVEEGLAEGEEVVTNGTFTIDAAAQLSGKASMMNPRLDSPESQPVAAQASVETFIEGDMVDFRDQTPDAFRKQLDKVIEAYLALKEGLVEADENATQKYSSELLAALNEVDGDLLEGTPKEFWEEKREFLMEHAQLCKEAPTMKGKRENFIYLSEPLIKVLEAFGAGQQQLYVDYCPMANDNKGAYWLSEVKEIRNPFMAEAMRTCGEVKDVINK